MKIGKVIPSKISLWILFLAISTLSSCGPSTIQDFHREGETLSKSLTKDLTPIETREELLKQRPSLEKKFTRLATLMVMAENFRREHPEESYDGYIEDTITSSKLEIELRRITQIEGAAEILEQVQQKALELLDQHAKRLEKKHIK